jgi:hypothetical protein
MPTLTRTCAATGDIPRHEAVHVAQTASHIAAILLVTAAPYPLGFFGL